MSLLCLQASREMVKKLWGTDADPLMHKSEWEQQLAKVTRRSGYPNPSED
ncbi:MAG TPA: hypothetical protein VKA67_08890 [Verrucomicrobiae bacterium]|nr:hypothetical protein [Verrucomicrobiae bacterium]